MGKLLTAERILEPLAEQSESQRKKFPRGLLQGIDNSRTEILLRLRDGSSQAFLRSKCQNPESLRRLAAADSGLATLVNSVHR